MIEKNQPFVSIALCTYNGSEFLDEQLVSILNQDYCNYEVVIVDDASTDDTRTIISSYLQDSRIRFYKNQENLGYAANFSKAMSLCKGELIALSDQDDIWLPEKIKLMVERMEGVSGLYHNSAFMTKSGQLTGLKLTDKVRFVSGKYPESLLLYNYVGGHTLMLKRDVLNHALPVPQGIYHDWWLAFVCMNLHGLDYIEKPLVHYRIHDSNQTVLEEQSRKMYKTDTRPVKRYKKLRKLAVSLQILRTLNQAPFINDQLRLTIDRLINLQKGRIGKFFSFELFYFLIKHLSIYKSGHRGYLGKLNAMRKDSFGIYKCQASKAFLNNFTFDDNS
ncbi:glycosyltransferase family 2 protein [Daejeonella sp.]|uniref:glycosyltransferase family 2 protein n=1 Tax=Daejeonella sp. TaxID=2805397 RepID=UPI0030BC5EB2